MLSVRVLQLRFAALQGRPGVVPRVVPCSGRRRDACSGLLGPDTQLLPTLRWVGEEVSGTSVHITLTVCWLAL